MEDGIAATQIIRDALSSKAIGRARGRIGGSHTTVTYPPLDALDSIAGSEVEASMEPSRDLNLYFHVAFCEFICPFCHYAKTYSPVDNEREDVLDYLGAVFREIELRQELIRASHVSSVYIGGGTPTVLDGKRLGRFLEKIQEACGTPPALFCVETSPITIAGIGGAEKAELLYEAGVNRISMGVQTFDEILLQRYRGHRLSDMLRGLEILQDTGITLNVDLIQDLPDQSAKSLDHDIELIGKLRPHQVTWYMMRPSREAPWFKDIQRGQLAGIPDDKTSALRRYHIIRAMQDLGYVMQSGGRFVRDDSIVDTYKTVRGGLNSDLLGIGMSSYSHGWGHFFRNVTNYRIRSGIRDYVSRIRDGASPIDTGLKVSHAERRAGARVTGIREKIPASLLQGDDTDSQTARRIAAHLENHGLAESDLLGGLSLTSAGRAFEEEIATLFYSQSVLASLAERGQFWVDEHYPELASIMMPNFASTPSVIS
nr:radical SAM protein [uncultured Hyphomonas sp.]